MMSELFSEITIKSLEREESGMRNQEKIEYQVN